MQNILTNGHSKDLPYLQPVASSKRLGSVIGKTHPLSAPSSPAVGQRMNISLFSTRNAFQPANASTDQPREQSLFVSKRVIHSSATQCKGPRRKATQRRHSTPRNATRYSLYTQGMQSSMGPPSTMSGPSAHQRRPRCQRLCERSRPQPRYRRRPARSSQPARLRNWP